MVDRNADNGLTGRSGRENRLASEQTLISSLYLCLGERGQEELHKRRPLLDLGESRYPRVLHAMEGEFKKERNETYEVFQLLSRKHRFGESLEQFHVVLSGLAARCVFGALEARILRDVFIFHMTNREAQNELCRTTKTPEEALRIAQSYERGDTYAKSYVTTGGTASSSTAGGGISIKSEPVGVIRGGYRNSRGRRRGQAHGRGSHRGGGGGRERGFTNTGDRRFYNCDKPGFTREHKHMNESAARNVTCNFCRKIGHFERTCRAKKNSRSNSSVGVIQEQANQFESEETGDEESQQKNSVGWVR